jgi:hypothetical protein
VPFLVKGVLTYYYYQWNSNKPLGHKPWYGIFPNTLALSTLVMGKYFINQALKKPGLSLTLVMGIFFHGQGQVSLGLGISFGNIPIAKGLKKK